MTSEKKLTAVRILVYVVLAFLPAYIVTILLTDDPYSMNMLESFAIMFSPALAHLLTRVFTKEGFSGMFLRADLKHDIKYYLLAILYAVLCNIITLILFVVVYLPDYKLSDVVNGDNALEFFAYLFTSLTLSITISFICFGEEFGWRAYLTPKLEKLMPTSATLVVSGIIWGLWHAPLILKGYNFGTAHPRIGLLLMCIACIFYGVFLSWLTKRTNSIYPASLCHSCIDNLPISAMLLGSSVLPTGHDLEFGAMTLLVPSVILGVFAWAMIIIDGKKSAKTAA